MYVFASSPLETLRTPRMTFEAPSRTMWFAASRPRPVFEPVMMTVWLEKDWVGGGTCTKSWERVRERKAPGLRWAIVGVGE